MPRLALAALGVVLGFGLFAQSTPGWCSGLNAEHELVRSAGTTSEETEKNHFKPETAMPELTLDAVLELALKKNPELAAYSQEISAREFEARQAGLRPNPELSVEMENFGGSGNFSGTAHAETTVRLSQLLELGGKRTQRRRLGHTEKQLAREEYEIARAGVLSEAAQRFIAVLAAQKRLTLAEEQVGVTRKVLRAVEERIETGKTAAVESVRFRALLAESSLRKEKALQDLAAARKTLAAVWGSREVDFGSVRGDLEKVDAVPEWMELSDLLDQSPAIALLQAEAEKGERILALERANRIPDLTVSLGVKNDRETGDDAVVAEIAIPLPIFDRNQGAVAAAKARREKAEQAKKAVAFQLQADLTESWRKLQAASSEVDSLRDTIIPSAQKAFNDVTYGYRAGKFGFLEVLDAERTLFEARSRNIDALATYHKALIELEGLLGQNIFPEEGIAASSGNKRGES